MQQVYFSGCFLVFFGVFWMFFGVFWTFFGYLLCPFAPKKDFFHGLLGVGGWVGLGAVDVTRLDGWILLVFFWKFGCFLVFRTAQDAAAGPCLVSCLSWCTRCSS